MNEYENIFNWNGYERDARTSVRRTKAESCSLSAFLLLLYLRKKEMANLIFIDQALIGF